MPPVFSRHSKCLFATAMPRVVAGAFLIVATLSAPSLATAQAGQAVERSTLYERLGGYDAIVDFVGTVFPRVAQHPQLAHFFRGHGEDSQRRQFQLVVDAVCAATGGPCIYLGRQMTTVHKGLGITDANWDTFIKIISDGLREKKYPDDVQADFLEVWMSFRPGIVEQPNHAQQETVMTTHTNTTYTNKDAAVAIIKQGVARQDTDLINDVVREDYIQHNPTVPDGREGVLALIERITSGALPAPEIEVKRTLSDGDYVVVHSDLNWGGRKAMIEIFRFEDGRAAEHWSGIQDQPAQTANGHTMVDGTARIEDLAQTEANKALVKDFIETIFVHGHFDRLDTYFGGDHYIQHNPMIADGVSGLKQGLEEMQKAGITVTFDRIHKVLGEGNFVLTLSEGTFNGKPTAFYDLFRVEHGKIAEHWDVLQEIPEAMAHDNGMF